MTTTSSRYSPEVQARAVRLVLEHAADYPSQWSAIQSIASKIGCTAETHRRPLQGGGLIHHSDSQRMKASSRAA